MPDFRVAWRQLVSDPAYALVVVFGLALAIAAGALSLAYLKAVVGADSDVPQPDRVVRLETTAHTPGAPKGWIVGSPLPFYDHWFAVAPVQAASRYFVSEMAIRVGPRLLLQEVSFVDPGIVDILGLVAVSGDVKSALLRPDGVSLSRDAAIRLFGAADVIGKTLQLASKQFTVHAVTPGRPRGSAISTDVMINITSPVMPEQFRLKGWFSLRGSNFVRLLPNTTPESLAERAQAYFSQTPAYKEAPPTYGKIATFRAMPLTDLPLTGAESEATRRLVTALTLAALISLVLASINYVNLSTVRALARQREIGIRKALGADPGRVATQFLTESVLVSLIACLMGLLLAAVVAPIVSEWIDRPLRTQLFNPATVIQVFAISVILGLLAGAFPAWVAMRISCAQSLAGRGQAETVVGLWVRRSLTIFQFSAALALLAISVVVMMQARMAAQSNPGYATEPILIIDAPVDMNDGRLLALREDVKRLPMVEAVGLAWDMPGRFRRHTSTVVSTPQGRDVAVAFNRIGPDYFQSYGVRPLAGRVFDPERDKQGNNELVVINARASREFGFTDPAVAVGAKLLQTDKRVVEIIGVIPDIRQKTLRDLETGVIYSISNPTLVSVMSVRSEDPARVRREISEMWPRHFPDEVLRVNSAGAHFQRLYENDARLGQLAAAGGILALGLAAFGLYALSAYTVRRRTREIVLRKLHGARPKDIALLLMRDFSWLLLIGSLIGLPVAAWINERFLSTFVERASVEIQALVLALFVTSIVAFFAAARHTVRAMRLPPANILQN